MAIAKVALAGRALLSDGMVREVRLAAASLAPFPTRLYRAEEAICGKPVEATSVQAARAALFAEVLPIDDIRSTAEYRRRVAANLLEEFLTTLQSRDNSQ